MQVIECIGYTKTIKLDLMKWKGLIGKIMSHSTQSSKTASEVIKEMYLATIRVIYLVILFSLISGIIFISYKVYLYFQENTIQEMGMDFLIIALPTILIYSIHKQIKRVRQGGKA